MPSQKANPRRATRRVIRQALHRRFMAEVWGGHCQVITLDDGRSTRVQTPTGILSPEALTALRALIAAAERDLAHNGAAQARAAITRAQEAP